MAADESSMLIAARENATSRKNISDLQSILHDLMLNTRIIPHLESFTTSKKNMFIESMSV